MIRLFDIVLSTVAILCLLPLFLVVMVVLKLTGENEVFYCQERIGEGGKPFPVLKFATMLKDSPNLPGGYLTRENDPRVLPIGRVLRKTKVNEFPQLFNVFLGQMSFVGPRPQARVHYEMYSEAQRDVIDGQTPGVTGLAALVFRDEEGLLERFDGDSERFHDEVLTPYKGELECWWAANRSSWLYWKVIFLSAVSLVLPNRDYLSLFPDAPRPGPKIAAVLGQEGAGRSVGSSGRKARRRSDGPGRSRCERELL